MSEPRVIAHRGFAGGYPENTVAALSGAADRGADMVELDVQPTADGNVVVIHDSELDGLTDGSGVVWEQSTATVTAAQVLGTEEQVPTLTAVFEALPAAVGVNIELKNPGTESVRPGQALAEADREQARERWQSFVESVIAVTERFDHDILFSSFCEGALAALAAHNRKTTLAALVAPTCADAGMTVTHRYDVDAIHPPLEQCTPDTSVDWAQVAADLDASLNVWTVTDWLEARAAVRGGADGIIADYPGLLNGL